MSSLPAWRLWAKTGEKDATSSLLFLLVYKRPLSPNAFTVSPSPHQKGRISTWELLIQVMDSIGFSRSKNPSGVRHSLHVRKALELVTHFTLRGILWNSLLEISQSLSVFLVFLERNYFFRFQKWNSSKRIMKSKLDFLNTCLLTKRLQVGKSNIPIHVSIWFFRLFPTWRVVPNTYFGWGLGEVQRRTSRKEKPYLQSPKGLLVKLLVPFSISSPKKDHFYLGNFNHFCFFC